MGYRVSRERMDVILASLRDKYRVFAPKQLTNRGQNPVRYGEIRSVSEIILDLRSDFSPKEVYYPIAQTMYHIRENAFRPSGLEDGRGMVVFARPCDINAVRRLDAIFLKNGGTPDAFYRRRREKARFFMLECLKGWDDCFCVSMGANVAGDYSAAFRFEGGEVLADVKDGDFGPYFAAEAEADFQPGFVLENAKKVAVPQIALGQLRQVHGLDMWKDYNEKCISCGGCNAVCGTCGCFDTADIIYDETSRGGERRRVWAGCMQESFTAMAGGHKVRNSPGDRMRFKTLHKVYDFKARFGEENMCVGCGRCGARCPADISFSDIVNRLSAEMEKLGGAR